MLPTTPGWPVDTRETVCEETPASRATSAIDTRAFGRLMARSFGGVRGRGRGGVGNESETGA
ncbi:hypothetical protein Cba03nite_36430 [Catellatospora bangladeshensis]|uniref:Uncharacterized protein n=1 Tax=Catellatospora bangladeshensis TaxID=310355 RepID=A0A8J3JR35_9ACTN|nr:hypothetical protein Cba03nite_36430 [Catellatospora bangladeshensis]